QEAFNGGIAGIGKLLVNWSPAGLLYKAFAAALKYLGVDLPAKFTDFGGHLIDGLINGIRNKWESLKTSITGMGDSISDWFSEKLGIHSPSRVFIGFGDNIAQGAAIGLQRTTPLAALAGQRLAAEMTPDVPRIPSPEIMAAGYSGRGATATGGGASGGIQVSFNPQFFLNGKETAAPAGLAGALNMSLHELEKMLERLLAQKQRKEYS
ncbi:phage tail tape measure protein, partial [Escherichia coli]|nr:phage tail tape measure protein [Escherichia coli]